MTNPTPKQIRDFCRTHADQACIYGECDATLLAENCADHFDCDFWLDNIEHVVWEIALTEAEKYGFGPEANF